MEIKKKKILMLSDHALCTSGVGVQSRHLIEGLQRKYPGEWSFRQFGAAIKHANYDVIEVNPDFIIKPIDGFGNPDLLRQTLATERPDAIFLFTDPRFFIWLFEMEDEIHQHCPIVWWHVWDNRPTPEYNKVLYEATDLINCHSHLTYEMCSELFPEKSNFIPHSLPENIFKPLNSQQKSYWKNQLIGPERHDYFTCLWVNRNARRKRPGDLLWAWSLFVDELEKKYGHRKVNLIMHTDPADPEGPNLMVITEHLNLKDVVIFSTDRVDFDQMNALHNISDCCINVSYAEGFGLPTLEAMQTGTPIIAAKTGGLTRQVVDHRDDSENGFALDISLKSLVGSQTVPYIYEDYCSAQEIADALMKMYELGDEGREKLGQKARKYVLEEFSHDTTIDLWHETLKSTIENWRDTYSFNTKITI
tara:strand:- start:5054 stop:6310 length:1257 start_codon:yes stop_codon:yes gene_type:complete